MTIKFYDHLKTGKVHFRASSGGGDGLTSTFDAPATADHIAKNPVEYNEYLRLKKDGSAELKTRPTDLASRDLYIKDLEGQLARAKAEIERLNALVAGLV